MCGRNQALRLVDFLSRWRHIHYIKVPGVQINRRPIGDAQPNNPPVASDIERRSRGRWCCAGVVAPHRALRRARLATVDMRRLSPTFREAHFNISFSTEITSKRHKRGRQLYAKWKTHADRDEAQCKNSYSTSPFGCPLGCILTF